MTHVRWLIEVLSIVGCLCLGVAKLSAAEGIMAHGAPVTLEDTMARLIDSAAQDMNERLAAATRKLQGDPENRGAAFMQARNAELISQMDRIRAKYAKDAAPICLEANKAAYEAGIANTEKQLAEMGIKEAGDAIGGLSFNLVNEGAIEAIARDTMGRMNATLTTHATNAQSLFRSFSTGPLQGVVHEAKTNEIIAKGIISGNPRAAIKELRGLIGNASELEGTYRQVGNKLIEVGNATMSVRHYAMTVVRTRTREATTEAQISRQLKAGLDLAQITGKKSDNFCTDYLGLVVVLRGPARDGYISISEIGKPPFHPNCSKTLTAFSAEVASEARLERARAASVAYRNSLQESAAA